MVAGPLWWNPAGEVTAYLRTPPDLALLASGLDQVLVDPDNRRVVATIRAGRLVYRA